MSTRDMQSVLAAECPSYAWSLMFDNAWYGTANEQLLIVRRVGGRWKVIDMRLDEALAKVSEP